MRSLDLRIINAASLGKEALFFSNDAREIFSQRFYHWEHTACWHAGFDLARVEAADAYQARCAARHVNRPLPRRRGRVGRPLASREPKPNRARQARARAALLSTTNNPAESL